MQSSYDFIIVGAGSSGCVLANRLSADAGVSVLLIDSGPADRSPLISMPMGLAKLLGPESPYISRYQASPGSGYTEESWVKGRTLGGSSSINGMVYTRGAPADYDGWALEGCPGWGWDEISRCYEQIEHHQLGPAPGRGGSGPLYVGMSPQSDPLIRATIAAAGEMGVPVVEDINDIAAVTDGGFGLQPRNIRRGRRFSAARAFLRPALQRKNLEVVTNAEVFSIVLEGATASGVRVRYCGADRVVSARREVILCAGAINSPCLLQRSGIGPAGLLESLGIKPVIDLAGVGQNLCDHRTLPLQLRVKRGGSNLGLQGAGLVASVLKYFFLGTGALAQSTFVAGGFVKTSPDLERPDVQVGIGPFTSTAEGVRPYPAITLFGYTLRPESRGEVAITSADPGVSPRINANYMATPYDRQNAIAIFRWLRKLAAQPALAPYIEHEILPGPDIEEDEALLEASFTYGNTGYHVAGTCRMGTDDAAVLDHQLRVRGVEGLRVVDTSMMPSLVSGNTNAPAMAIAWRAAELILNRV